MARSTRTGAMLPLLLAAVTMLSSRQTLRRCEARMKEVLIRRDEPRFDALSSFGIDELLPGNVMGSDRYLVPLEDQRPRLNPLLVTPPVAGCDDASHPCFLQIDRYGNLAVMAGTGPSDPKARALKTIGGPQTSGVAGQQLPQLKAELTLQTDGNVVLRTVASNGNGKGSVLWSAGTSLPSNCYPDTACAREAHVSMLPDGSLALFLGLSSAGRAYIEVALPALKHMESCLWHNDFTGEGVDAPAVAAAAAAADHKCYSPPIMSLISFPSSGTSFTLTAVVKATNNTAFTASPAECTVPKNSIFREICGKDSWLDMGMCPQTAGPNAKGLPPPGKAALLKNHVMGDGSDALCSQDLFTRAMLMSDAGVPFMPYGFARLFRDPFDNMVGRMHHQTDDLKLYTTYSKEGFLAEGALYPQHDIWTFMYWHLNANLALKRLNKPTALLKLKDVDANQAAYIRRVITLLGYTEKDVTGASIGIRFPGERSPEEEAVQRRFRYGDVELPVHIDFYDAATVHYVAGVINTVLSGSQCMTRQFCVEPPEGFRDMAVLDRKHR